MSLTDTLRADIQASLTGRDAIEREVGGGRREAPLRRTGRRLLQANRR